MAQNYAFPQQFPSAQLLNPATDAAGRTSNYVSLKTAHKAWVVFHITQGNAATITLSILQAKDVSGTSSKALVNVARWWAALDEATTDVKVRQTDAVSYTTDAGVKNKTIIAEIDPAMLDLSNGFVTIAVSTGASNAANITSAQVYVSTRYKQDQPPSLIIN